MLLSAAYFAEEDQTALTEFERLSSSLYKGRTGPVHNARNVKVRSSYEYHKFSPK